MGRLVVMGSGETAPTMLRTHRELCAATPPGGAVVLDTPFAFQTNRAAIAGRIRDYFRRSVGHEVEVVSWSGGECAAEQARALALLDRASWVFAGPGSPTYALRRWQGTPVPKALGAVLRRGGTVILGSAAALTLGSHTVPVYEVYKVGADPVWVPGLDLLGELTGLAAAVIPHFDNAEGATHDTRYCYLGQERLAALERQLPAGVGVLGVDEHTALVLDLAAETATVAGRGSLSVRRRDATVTFGAGTVLGLGELSARLRGDVGVPGPAAGQLSAGQPPVPPAHEPRARSVAARADEARAGFDAALAAGDAPGCLSAVLGLQDVLAGLRLSPAGDDDAAEGHRVLRALVVRLGELAERGAADPARGIEPFVTALLDVRQAARSSRDYATADLVRSRLAAAGVDVRDTAEGTHWQPRRP